MGAEQSDAELLEWCDELERRHQASGYAVGTYDLTKIIAAARRSVELRKRLDESETLAALDRAIVEAAERWFDARNDDISTAGALIVAARAKRAALKPTP